MRVMSDRNIIRDDNQRNNDILQTLTKAITKKRFRYHSYPQLLPHPNSIFRITTRTLQIQTCNINRNKLHESYTDVCIHVQIQKLSTETTSSNKQ